MSNKTYNLNTTDTGRWYCFCSEVPISVTWEDKKFDATQQWDYTGEGDELAIARETRELNDWLAKNHPEKIAGACEPGEDVLDEQIVDWRAVELEMREEVGRMISALRQERDLTQAELGELSDLSRNHICRIEAGRYNVTIDTLSRILYALGAELDILYADDSE